MKTEKMDQECKMVLTGIVFISLLAGYVNGCNFSTSDIDANLLSRCEFDRYRWEKYKHLAVSCTGQKFTSIQVSVPCTTELDMSFNNLIELKSGSFANKNLNKLKSLMLSNNKIRNISSDAFISLPNLRKLDLSFNKLTDLSAHMFSNNVNLREIDIKNNSKDMNCSKIKHEFRTTRPKTMVFCNNILPQNISETDTTLHMTTITNSTPLPVTVHNSTTTEASTLRTTIHDTTVYYHNETSSSGNENGTKTTSAIFGWLGFVAALVLGIVIGLAIACVLLYLHVRKRQDEEETTPDAENSNTEETIPEEENKLVVSVLP